MSQGQSTLSLDENTKRRQGVPVRKKRAPMPVDDRKALLGYSYERDGREWTVVGPSANVLNLVDAVDAAGNRAAFFVSDVEDTGVPGVARRAA